MVERRSAGEEAKEVGQAPSSLLKLSFAVRGTLFVEDSRQKLSSRVTIDLKKIVNPSPDRYAAMTLISFV